MSEFLSLKEYEDIAVKCLSKYAPRFRNNDEAIGLVIYYMAKADQRFDGRGNRRSFMGENARFACKKLNSQRFRYTTGIFDSIDKKQKTPISILIEEEYGTVMKGRLKKIQSRYRKYLLKYYYEGMTYQQIADEDGITRERVRQVISLGLRKLKGVLDAAK